jgi:hypothetical protein
VVVGVDEAALAALSAYSIGKRDSLLIGLRRLYTFLEKFDLIAYRYPKGPASQSNVTPLAVKRSEV